MPNRILSSVEQEQQLVKRLQNSASLPLPPLPLLKQTSPFEQSFAVSSIAPSSSQGPAPQFSPKLPPLAYTYHSSPVPRLINCFQEHEKTLEQAIDVMEIQSTHLVEEMRELQTKLNEAIKKGFKNHSIEKKWHVWETVWQYVNASFSFVLGLGLLATNGDKKAAGCLLASGGLSLTNQIMTDLEGWKALAACFTETAEKQETIADRIQMGAILTSAALALTGAALTLKERKVSTVLPKKKIEETILPLALTFLDGGTRLVSGAIKQRSSSLEAKIIDTNTKITLDRRHLTDMSDEQEELLDLTMRASEVVKKVIEHLSTL